MVMKKPNKEKNSRFFMTFAGEVVHINLKHFLQTQEATEEGTVMSQEPMAIMGYLIDEDDDYYFLGETDQAATQSVRKSEVLHVSIVDPLEIMRAEGSMPNIPEGELN
jgi:hypothetical protein